MPSPNTLLVRSALFVPAIRERFIEKAPDAGADMICIDLEDSVALAEKPKGREMARNSMPGMKRTGYLMAVRVNSLQSGLIEADLDAVVISELQAIGLPKADDPEIIKRVDHYLTILEKTRGIPVGQVKIFPWIESALGLINAYALCTASPRVTAASVGGEDLTSDMGMERTREGRELEYARNLVATACIAAGVVPLDTVFADFRDTEGFEADTVHGKSIGFKGRYCIHPSQVPVVNGIYRPTDSEVENAHKVVDAYEEGTRQGLGAVNMGGVMVDKPVYDRAISLIGRLRLIEEKGG